MDNWKDIVAKAEHYKAIGQTDIYLSLYGGDRFDAPWKWALSCEAGGSHRLDISTDVSFYAEHPSGLAFRWSFEIEPHSQNGKGSYAIDIDGITRAMALLPSKAANQFRRYLAGCAEKVRAKGQEWEAIAKRQFADADALDVFANEK